MTNRQILATAHWTKMAYFRIIAHTQKTRVQLNMSTDRFNPKWSYDLNQDNAVMVHIDAGKLGTKGRVNQSAQKGSTCHYYTLNYLRPRVGKTVPAGMEEQRKLEVLFSSQRKTYTKLSIERSCELALATYAEAFKLIRSAQITTIGALQQFLLVTLKIFATDNNLKKRLEKDIDRKFTKEHESHLVRFAAELAKTYEYYLAKGYKSEELLDFSKLTTLTQARTFIAYFENCFKELQLDINECYKQFSK